jgi:hypothetical protein
MPFMPTTQQATSMQQQAWPPNGMIISASTPFVVPSTTLDAAAAGGQAQLQPWLEGVPLPFDASLFYGEAESMKTEKVTPEVQSENLRLYAQPIAIPAVSRARRCVFASLLLTLARISGPPMTEQRGTGSFSLRLCLARRSVHASAPSWTPGGSHSSHLFTPGGSSPRSLIFSRAYQSPSPFPLPLLPDLVLLRTSLVLPQQTSTHNDISSSPPFSRESSDGAAR